MTPLESHIPELWGGIKHLQHSLPSRLEVANPQHKGECGWSSHEDCEEANSDLYGFKYL